MFKSKNNSDQLPPFAPPSDTKLPPVEPEYDRSVPPTPAFQQTTTKSVAAVGSNSKLDRDKIQAIVTKIRQSQTSRHALNVVVTELQTVLGADRVLICEVTDNVTGKISAEAVREGFAPAMGQDLPLIAFGMAQASDYQSQRYIELDRSKSEQISPYQKQLLENYQVNSQLTFPILLNGYATATNNYGLQQVWGLLIVHQCDRSKQWSDAEINLLGQISLELTLAIQPSLPLLQLVQNRDPLSAIDSEARTLIHNLTEQVRSQMQVDRVMAFAFNPDWSGKIIAESVDVNWVKAGDRFNLDYSITGDNYKPFYAVNDIQTKGLSKCLIEILESYQIRAYLVVPILYNGQLIGLLGAYQNSGPRNWQKAELELLQTFAERFNSPLQQTVYQRHQEFQSVQMNARFDRERGLAKMQERIRTAKTEEQVFQIATQEGRKLLTVDRLAVYKFNPDWSGNFIAESVGGNWNSLIETIPLVQDTFLQRTEGGRYKDGGTMAIDDIYLSGHQACHIELLEQFEARAYVIAPIFGADKKLWGLIAMYQNDRVRKWQEEEVEALRQIGLQVGMAMEQLDYLGKLKTRAEQQQTINKITDRIRQSLAIDSIFQNVTQEIRQALNTDRCVVYQFNSDWSGQVVAESVGGGWVSLLQEQAKDGVLTGDRTSSDRCVLRKWGTQDNTETDTYLQQTQGGKYGAGQSKFTAINDIYAQNYPACYIQSLEKYEAKAYLIAPIFQGEKLWGLLGVYQNDAPRQWSATDSDTIVQIASQLAVAIQLSTYVNRVETQERELAESLARERSAREGLEQEAVKVLKALEPSFRGDLTIRAPLSESEIGTIADGYNTTIQSLRNLVRQVQVSAASMSETSSHNNVLVESLSTQAQGELDKLESAISQANLMVDSSKEVANFAQKIDLAVQSTNFTVQKGDRLIESTVVEILEIRSTVSETGKKVKRLGETFQKISKVVSLIENFATQTNLLALNAAIEATRAGEYGKGFAVVADEVRSLAHQSANATTEIGRLVDEIRAGTNEVTEAMEVGIAQVVQGTQMVNDTRATLSEIVTATSEIGELVQSITNAANNQSTESQKLTIVMNDVAEIVTTTADSASQLSESFKQLLTTSKSLETSVSKFKVD
jgi:methyl-accepting chemotaxis protein PixJ